MQTSEQILEELFGQGLGRGRPAKKGACRMAYTRDLERTDILALAAGGRTKDSPLTRIRTTHHYVARLLAEGRKNIEIAAITGYSPARIVQLKRDPAFQELVAHYSEQVKEVYLNVHERLCALGVDTIEELQRRLDEAPETFKNEELQKQVALLLDRAGYGPKSTINHTGGVAILTDEALSRIKSEAENRRVGAVRALEDGSRTIDSIPVGSAAEIPGEEVAETEGDESGGPGVRAEIYPFPRKDTS